MGRYCVGCWSLNTVVVFGYAIRCVAGKIYIYHIFGELLRSVSRESIPWRNNARKGPSLWGGNKFSSFVMMCGLGMESQDSSRFMPMSSDSSARPPGIEDKVRVVPPEEVRENIVLE